MRSWYAWLGAGLAFWPVWKWYALRTVDGSDDSLGILALAAGLAFLWQGREHLRWTRAGLAGAGVLLLLYLVSFAPAPSLVRAFLVLGMLACLSGSLVRLPAVWGLFVLSLPLVASLQFYLGFPLRLLAAEVASALLTGLGMAVEQRGTQLWWNGQEVGVEAACSGIKMLWMGLFLVLVLAARLRLGPGRTLLALGIGVAALVGGNALRVTLLFLKESGAVSLPEWTHQGIGLLVFGLLISGLGAWMGRFSQEEQDGIRSPMPPLTRARLRPVLSLVVVLTALVPFFPPHPALAKRPGGASEFPGWPENWGSHLLEPLTLSPVEQRFAGQFPGRIGAFASGGDKLIVRWVTRPTRKLHSSADCLRASGFEIWPQRPGVYLASRGEERYQVREWIFEGALEKEADWREVEAWFWSAALGRSQGPWWAVTELRGIQ